MKMKRRGLILLLCLLFGILCCSCGRSETADTSEAPIAESTAIPANMSTTSSGTTQQAESEMQVVQSDLVPSGGLDFKSNADGTCTLAGIGICKDTDLVIPGKSPDGEVVSRIEERAFWSLEDINSVTLLNMTCVVEERAFQYGEFTRIALLGGDLTIEGSAFSSCEDVTEITVQNCTLKAEEYAFFSCGNDASAVFTGVNGELGDRAFQYADLAALTFNGCSLTIQESAFSSCEALTSVSFLNSTLQLDEYAFFGCGDKAEVHVQNCTTQMDDRAFQYSSLTSLTVQGGSVSMGDSVFASCEDLLKIEMSCEKISLGEYAFFSCEDLTTVSLGQNKAEVEIDDRAFQYCEALQNVSVQGSTVSIGKYVFSGGDDAMTVTVSGKTYSPQMLEDGMKTQ